MYNTTSMRLLISGIALIALNTVSFAQMPATASANSASLNDSTPSGIDLSGGFDTKTSELKIDTTLPNGIMLFGTTMVYVKNGVIKPLEKDVVFSNGTKVRKDGYIIRRNKHKILLNFDEYVDVSGKILPISRSSTLINLY